MTAFYYHLPNVSKNEILGTGQIKYPVSSLNEVLADCKIEPDHVVIRDSRGPDGPGCLVYARPVDGSDPEDWNYNTNKQRWIRYGKGPASIGWSLTAPPGPDDLRRRDQLICKWRCPDSDGNRWSIITARSEHPDGDVLPSSYVFDDDGEPIAKIKPDYQNLWELGDKVYEHFAEKEVNGILANPDSWIVKTALSILGATYRVGPNEINALSESGSKVLDTEFVAWVLMAFVDLPQRESLEKYLIEKKKVTDDQCHQDLQTSSIG